MSYFTFINFAFQIRKALDNPNLDPDKKVKYQERSALHLAAGYGHYSAVEELLYVRINSILNTTIIS